MTANGTAVLSEENTVSGGEALEDTLNNAKIVSTGLSVGTGDLTA